MRRLGLCALAMAVVGSSAVACGYSTSRVECSMAPAPTNPVEVASSWAYGAVVVVGVVGEADGQTRTFTPGYRTDRHRFDVERVVTIRAASPYGEPERAPVTEPDARAVTEIGNVHYPDQPPSCGGAAENASLHEGDRVLVILGPPQPTAEIWTVGPAVSVVELSGEPGSEVATWQHRTRGAGAGGCDGHLTYDLPALEAAFADPALASGLTPTCTPG